MPLLPQIAFAGGCATQLLITDPGAPPLRVTDDVDVIADLVSYAEYARFSNRLRKLGFAEDSSEGAPICRWMVEGMKLDVMPIDERILGFSNRWFKSALSHSLTIPFEGLELRVVTPAYFLATKLAALKGRAKGDFYASKDLEDVITLIDGRTTVAAEVHAAPANVRRYVSAEIRKLLANREFVNAIAGHLPGDAISQARIPRMVNALRSLSRLGRDQPHTSRRKSAARDREE